MRDGYICNFRILRNPGQATVDVGDACETEDLRVRVYCNVAGSLSPMPTDKIMTDILEWRVQVARPESTSYAASPTEHVLECTRNTTRVWARITRQQIHSDVELKAVLTRASQAVLLRTIAEDGARGH